MPINRKILLLPSHSFISIIFNLLKEIKELKSINSLYSDYGVPVEEVFAKEEEAWKRRGAYLSLILQPCSEESHRLVEALSKQAIVGVDRKYAPTRGFKDALGAFVATLLGIAADDRLSYGYRGMSPRDFNRTRIGYKPFRSVVQGMYEFRFIELKRGYKYLSKPDKDAKATRFHATQRLLDYVAEFGITLENWRQHFRFEERPRTLARPVTLKTEKTIYRDAEYMKVEWDNPTVTAIADRVNELNDFFATQVIEPDCHYGFVRMFACGDADGFVWDASGRLYSIGFGNYQQLPYLARLPDYPVGRRDIRINGEKTVELDIKASHLTILHAMAKQSLPNHPDPYVVPPFPRPVIKSLVTMALGYGKFHTDWTDKAVRTFAKKSKSGKDDLRGYSYSSVKEAVLKAIPLLQDWEATPFTWADLQFIESEVILDTIDALAMVHGIPALPVHDSIIVPVSKQAVAEQVLSDAFRKHVGVRPTIDAKWEGIGST